MAIEGSMVVSLALRSATLVALGVGLVVVLISYTRVVRDVRRRNLEARVVELLEDERVTRSEPLPPEARWITLRIGATSSDDYVEERRRVAASPARPTAFQYVQIGSSGDAHAFERDFAVVRFEITSDGESGAELVVSEPVDGSRRILLLFTPPLTAPAEWTVECRVPGMWDPLRSAGADAYEYRVRTDTITELAVSFLCSNELLIHQERRDPVRLHRDDQPATSSTTRFTGQAPPAGSVFRFGLIAASRERD